MRWDGDLWGAVGWVEVGIFGMGWDWDLGAEGWVGDGLGLGSLGWVGIGIFGHGGMGVEVGIFGYGRMGWGWDGVGMGWGWDGVGMGWDWDLGALRDGLGSDAILEMVSNPNDPAVLLGGWLNSDPRALLPTGGAVTPRPAAMLAQLGVALDGSPLQVLADERAARFVHGIGIHWYLDFIGPIQDTVLPTHELFPDVFILATEASVGSHFWERDVVLGCWERGNQYSHSILTVRPRGTPVSPLPPRPLCPPSLLPCAPSTPRPLHP